MHVATSRSRSASVGAFLARFALCVSWISAIGQTLPPGIQLRPLSSISVQPLQQANSGQTNLPADPQLSALSQRLQTWIAANSVKRAPFATAQNLASPQSQIQFRPDGIAGEIKRRFSKLAPRQQHANLGAGRGVAVSQQKARDFLRDHKSHLKVDDSDREFVAKGAEVDALGRHHVRFAQSYQGISVWPCEVTVHLDPDGDVDLVNSTSIETPRGVAVVPTLSPVQALARARVEVFGGNANVVSQPDLVIYGPIGAIPRLAWKFDMAWTDVDAKRCIVDALDGRILSAVSLVYDSATVGSGVDALGMTRALNLWQQGSTYYLVDTSKGMYDASSTPPSSSTTRGGITIYDSHNTPATSNPQTFGNPVFAVSASANSGWTPDAVSAAFALSQVYDYYYFTHGRNSLDNHGESIIALVRVGINFPNAYWNGQTRVMVFGDGYSRSLDVCGHELTHGVLNSIGDGGILEYQGQSGALNEALADIFGECVQKRTKGVTDWLVGSDLTIGAIRNLTSPSSFEIEPGRPYPSRMSEFIVTSQDQGGVHLNSVIVGHCFYLLAAGLDGGIGIGDAERIFYRAMNVHLQRQSQFVDARRACIASAEELFGIASFQARKTEAAFDAVEIVDAPPTSPPSSIPAVQAPDSTFALRWDSDADGYYLVRREAAKGDGTSGRFVDTVNYLASKRVSVSGNGEVMIFVTEDHDVGVGTTDGDDVELIGVSGLAHSVALSPDAGFLAMVLRDAGGSPTSQIRIADLEANTQRTYPLYATTSEGERLNIVRYADVMDFSSDGTRLIFDAYCEAVTSDGHKFRGWTLFALNPASGTIDTLVDLNSDYDIGNPALGNVRNNLVVFEVTDRQTGISTEIAGDLFTGKIGIIGTVDGLGVPGYTGDDSAIVYSKYDGAVASDFSLHRQAVAPDGITRSGSATKWMADADFGVIYRRGSFLSSNAPPSVAITTLTNGQILTTPGTITIQANANDVDGSVARVELYDGSIKLGTSAAAPFTFSWKNPPLGIHRLIARAVDNLGGTEDSASVEVFAYPPCTYSLSSTSLEFGAGGGTGTVAVTTGAWCDWSAINSNSWITISSGNAYRSNGVVSLIVSSNASAIERRGHLLIAGRTFSIVQYPPDLTRPTITIKAPSANSVLNNSLLTLTGTASDGQGVARVEYQLGSNVLGTADGTVVWSAPLELILGTNTVQVWSVDHAGNHSITNSRSFYYSRAGEGKGNYNGLVGAVDEVGISCSGYFTFNVSAKGAYSASILLAGKKYTASGQLGADGAVTNVVARSGTNVLITDWMVNLDGGDIVTGKVVSGSCFVPLAGYRPVFNAKTNQAPQAGKYTLIIPGQPGSTNAPEGDGYGTAIVDGNGKLKLSAVLADGTKASQSVPISKSATWPLFSSLNRGSGLLWSWVSFEPTLTNDLSGRLTWIKGPSPSSKHYANGFVSPSDLTGSRYVAPTGESNRVLGISEALLSFSGGNRSQTLDVNLALGPNGRVTNASPHKLSLCFTLSSGLFSGTITEQGTTRATTFKGAVLQKVNLGSGYFLGTNQSGRVLLHRSP